MREVWLDGSGRGQLVAPQREGPADGGLHHTGGEDGGDDQGEQVDSLLDVLVRLLNRLSSTLFY